MKTKPTLLIIFCMLWSMAVSSQPAIKNQHPYGGSNVEVSEDIIQTADDGFLLLSSTSSIDYDAVGNHGSKDALLIKLDSDKNVEWKYCYGGSAVDIPVKVVQTSDGGYLIGAYSASNDQQVVNQHGGYDFWLLKLDVNGAVQWSKCFGGSGDERLFSLTVTPEGDYLAAGNSASDDFDVTGNIGAAIGSWFIKVSPAGDLIWQQCCAGINSETATDIVVNGNYYYVSGLDNISHYPFLLQLDTAGTHLSYRIMPWMDVYISSVIDLGSDGLLIGGNIDSATMGILGDYDCFIAKVDTAFDIKWTKVFGGPGIDQISSVSKCDDGNFLFSATVGRGGWDITRHYGHNDLWLVKFDTDGNRIWQKSYGGFSSETAPRITDESDGIIYMYASTISDDMDINFVPKNWDTWFIELSSENNTISGSAFFDFNFNSIQDANEPAVMQHKINETTTSDFSFTDNYGRFELNLFDTGSFIVNADPVNYFQSVPLSRSYSFSTLNNTDSTCNFAFQPTTSVFDLGVFASASRIRPGRNAYCNIRYCNSGTIAQNGQVSLKLDVGITFVSSSVAPTYSTADSVVWDVGTVLPGTSDTIFAIIHADTTLLAGDSVTTQVLIQPVLNDANPDNNFHSLENMVFTSLDPNEITCNRQQLSTQEVVSGTYIYYTIYFQNTGNDTAFDVHVLNNIPSEAEMATFELVDASHSLAMSYNSNTRMMDFAFANIMLPDSGADYSGSNGYVTYRIKLLSVLVAGDSIINDAEIFFDFNTGVKTNSVSTIITTLTDVVSSESKSNVYIYPNPVINKLQIITDEKSGGQVVITDITGRVQMITGIQSGLNTIDVSDFTSGMYLIRLIDHSGNMKWVHKVIKK